MTGVLNEMFSLFVMNRYNIKNNKISVRWELSKF